MSLPDVLELELRESLDEPPAGWSVSQSVPIARNVCAHTEA